MADWRGCWLHWLASNTIQLGLPLAQIVSMLHHTVDRSAACIRAAYRGAHRALLLHAPKPAGW